MKKQTTALRVAVMLGALTCGSMALAQDDPFGDEPIDDVPESSASHSGAESEAGEPDTGEPSAEPSEESSAEEGSGVTGQTSAEAEASLDLSAAAAAGTLVDDSAALEPAAPSADQQVLTGSHIRRPRSMVDGVLVIDSPLATEVQSREYLFTRRQLGGVALPDTTAALGHGGSGTLSLVLRHQPTLILLNGRRLVDAPYPARRSANFVDLNQLPITLIDRVEFSRGLAAGLYGDGAIGGVVNFVTRRDYEGLEVDLGGQTTDKFDQHEEDISLTLGAGSEETGVTAMASYFHRSPLAATDRDWIGDREDIVESLLGAPNSYQQASNLDYPFPDPACDIATRAGDANGFEVRLRGFHGSPERIFSVLPELGGLPDAERRNLLTIHDMGRGTSLNLGSANNNSIDMYETSTYCTSNFTGNHDLVLREERIQTYATLWHKFSKHTEAYGEFGYYRNDNENRTAPSFPLNRITPDPNDITPVWVPREHADQPLQERGFASVEVAEGRFPNNQFLVGRIIGNYAGSDINKRRVDVFRGVLGLDGDFKDLAKGSVVETWDWDLSGTYSSSEALATVHDVLMDKLADALNSCSATKIVERQEVPTTIKDRQEAGCFNPFYSAVVNNSALDPLNVSARSAPSENGFITSDTDEPGDIAFGLQDGGYICDPNDPNSPPCPAQFDRNGDGIFELAGTPNTKEVIDRIIGEQITYEKRSLGTIDGVLRGDLVRAENFGVAFALGGQFRREALEINYDAAYNQRLYGFLFGGDDVPAVSREIVAGFAELRLRPLKGLLELQPAVRVENYSDVGFAPNLLLGVAIRPLAPSSAPPPALEWLMLRGHVGTGHLAPSLTQMYGTQNEFHTVEFNGSTHFVPYQIHGNPDLDFEKYTTVSGGLQWDFVGFHIGADFWATSIKDMVTADNAQTLIRDCQHQFDTGGGDCREQFLLSMTRSLDHIESAFGNLAEVDTNGIDGGVSYTFDSKRRGAGDFGTFVLGVQGTFLNSYKIKSPRALREFYRATDASGAKQEPVTRPDGTRDYSNVSAEYEAAGWRNVENFAGPLPKLRFTVPLRWSYAGHFVGLAMRYIGGYNDDSEFTLEKYGLPNFNKPEIADGQAIDAWTVFDANYGITFDNDGWKLRFAIGAINLLDAEPPAVESPLGYEVGVHDPRGRVLYARLNGEF